MALGYSRYSPYSNTELYGNFLDVTTIPPIVPNLDDVTLTINKTYEYRPDLLAFDLYGNAELWWVFAVRNPNVIKDPVFDLRSGVEIFLPRKESLSDYL
jgi:hypothetical protein